MGEINLGDIVISTQEYWRLCKFTEPHSKFYMIVLPHTRGKVVGLDKDKDLAYVIFDEVYPPYAYRFPLFGIGWDKNMARQDSLWIPLNHIRKEGKKALPSLL